MFKYKSLSVVFGCIWIFCGCSGGGSDNSVGRASSSSSSASSSSASSSSSSTSSASSSSTSSASSSGATVGVQSDDFEGLQIDLLADNTSGWQVLHPEMSDGIDIGLSKAGVLSILAQSTEPAAVQGGWFEDEYSALVYKNITGNFAVSTRLRVVDRSDPIVTNTDAVGQGPDGAYNAGGFVLRDPAGTHTGDENWLMYNMGGQGLNGVTYAREIKKTLDSVSNLFLTRQDSIEETLLVCRIGDAFYFYTWDENTSAWQQETFYNNVEVNGQITTTGSPTGFSVVTEFYDPGFGNSMPMVFELDMPDTIQVGVIGHAWGAPYETLAEYDYVSFSLTAPTSVNECLSAITQP